MRTIKKVCVAILLLLWCVAVSLLDSDVHGLAFFVLLLCCFAPIFVLALLSKCGCLDDIV